MGWMVQLTPPGYVAAGLIFTTYHAVAAGVAPAGRWGVIGRPAAHTLVEAIRLSLPFGGVPLATMGVSQVGGPLAPLASVGGVILLTWVVFQIGFVLADAQARRMGGEPTSSATATAPCSPTSSDALRWCVVVLSSFVAPSRRGDGRRAVGRRCAGRRRAGNERTRGSLIAGHGTPPRSNGDDRCRPRPRLRAVAREHDRRERPPKHSRI